MGSWTERHNQLSYFEPDVVNSVLAAAGLELPRHHRGCRFLHSRQRSYNINLDYHQLSPRIGLAYQIDSKTVVRAGYGIFLYTQ